MTSDTETCHYCGIPAITVCLHCYKPICNAHSIDTGMVLDNTGEINDLPVCFPDCKIKWK